MSSQGHLLEMKNICKTFPGVKALDSVSFELEEGEVHALMGENGAGKSTLMKILTGTYKQDVGDVVYKGEVLEKRDERLTDVYKRQAAQRAAIKACARYQL